MKGNLSRLGISEPLPIQRASIPHAMERKNVLCSAPTGTGKTLCYLTPVLSNFIEKKVPPARPSRPRALILVPSYPLAIQVTRMAKEIARGTNVRISCVGHGAKYKPQMDKLRRGVDVVIGTPGRMLELRESGILLDSDVEYVAVDEADATLDARSDIGKEVRDVLKVVCDISPRDAFPLNDGRFRHRHAKRGDRPAQIVMAAATMTAEQQQEIRALFPDVEICVEGAVLPDGLQHRHLWIRSKDKSDPQSKPHKLLETLRGTYEGRMNTDNRNDVEEEPQEESSQEEHQEKPQTLVFCNSMASCRYAYHTIAEDPLFSDCVSTLHGGLKPRDRDRNLRLFTKQHKSILVCTDVVMRGLDFPSVENVIMFDFPYDATTYIHRVGRTARAGEDGTVTCLLTTKDRALFRGLSDRFDPKGMLSNASGRQAQSRKLPPFRRRRRRRQSTRRDI